MCDYPSVYRATVATARKPHVCVECRRRIEPGEIYEYVWGVWSGDPASIHTCAECFEVRAELFETMPSGMVYSDETACALAFGNLRETLATEMWESR